MATTYDPIASTTLASSASSVTFSSLDTIAAGYRDLVLVIEATGTGSATVRSDFNGDTTATNYFFVQMFGDGSSTSSSSLNASVFGTLTTSKSLNIIQALDFSATDKHKSFIYRDNRADSNLRAAACRWANTAAITSWNIYPSANQFDAGSVFSLYGISA